MQEKKYKEEWAFFELLRAGLWEKDVRLFPYGEINYEALLELAEEQSVVGLVSAGIEHVTDSKPQKRDVLQFIGRTVQLEQKNQAMNSFIGVLVDKMRKEGIYTLLVKGQGVAQCYDRPQWRSCGDVDFFLDAENYEKAKAYLTPMAASVEDEYVREKHLGMTIAPWVVELHGRLYSGLSNRIERELDKVYRETFGLEEFDGRGKNVRIWKDGETKVPLLAVENDAFYVFTHILQHFYKGGIGLRQICDWCRLLWTYRETLDVQKLESRLRSAGLMTEWRAFGAFAVEYLGMPVPVFPFYSNDSRWSRKARRIQKFILMSGNFGHNRNQSDFQKYPYLVRKSISFGRRMGDLLRHALIFPLDSLRFFPKMTINGLQSTLRGE